jgi:hypothetical protein
MPSAALILASLLKERPEPQLPRFVLPVLRAYPTFTGTSVMVSLPKMSITLTATV